MFVTEHSVEQGAPVAVKTLVDTVGAGDAFSSVSILGLLRGWGMRKTLQHALAFAAHLCEVRGAVLPDQSIYMQCLSEWNSLEEGVR